MRQTKHDLWLTPRSTCCIVIFWLIWTPCEDNISYWQTSTVVIYNAQPRDAMTYIIHYNVKTTDRRVLFCQFALASTAAASLSKRISKCSFEWRYSVNNAPLFHQCMYFQNRSVCLRCVSAQISTCLYSWRFCYWDLPTHRLEIIVSVTK